VPTARDIELSDAGDPAGAPLDLLLTDAVKGTWQRFAPDTTLLRTAGRLANRPRKLLGRVGGLTGELGRVTAGRSRLEPDAKDRDEVAEMISFLVSPAVTFSTGAVFDLSGGRATY
jgi:polyhydroxyalkanoate synthase subunit PhaC